MNFYNHIKNKISNITILKVELCSYFEVESLEIFELPENEIVIAIKIVHSNNEVFITTETSGISGVYSENVSFEAEAKNYLTKIKRDFKIDQILNSKLTK